jgi:hypothetical protein
MGEIDGFRMLPSGVLIRTKIDMRFIVDNRSYRTQGIKRA